jgi:hypothetical protein
MPLLNEETVLKIKSLPPDNQKRVLDGIAKLLSVRAGSHADELQGNGQPDGES